MATNLEKMIEDIAERQRSIGESVSAENIQRMIRENFDKLVEDPEFERKMRFGKSEPALIGSKYARWGLGPSEIEYLYDLQVSLTGQRKVNADGMYRGPSEELTKAYRAVSDAYYLSEDEVKQIDKRALDDLFPRIPKHLLSRNDQRLQARGDYERMSGYQRAMDTQESGYGSQLVGAQYVRDLWESARPDSQIFNLIDTFEMTDPIAYLPVEVDIPELLLVGESTANNSSNYDTVKTGSQRVQVIAKKFVIHQMWSGEMEEDSLIPFLPFLMRQAALSLAYYSDSLILNGDTTNAGTGNINSDDADPADTKHYLAWDGVRHAPIVDNTNNYKNVAGALAFTDLRDLRGLMLDPTYLVDWGHPRLPNDLIYAADPETADRIATLDEVIKARQMLGASADLLNGEVGRIIGHPILSSIAVKKTEADGKLSATPANNTKGQVVAFNRRGMKAGWRRRVRTETERLPATDQTRIVYSLRMGTGRFSPTGAASGIEWASCAGNISL